LAKPFRAGHAASTGVTCALLAAEGFTGDEQALEAPYGLLSAIGPVNDKTLSTLAQDLGREYDLCKHGVKVKNIAAGARTHAPVEAMLRLIKRRPLAYEDVESIACDVHPYPLVRLSPTRGHEGRFSMAYCLAVALIFGRLDATDFTDALVRDERVQTVMRLVRHTPGSKTLSIELKDGTTLIEQIQPASDMREWSEVAGKFYRSVRDILTEAQQASILHQVDRLEEIVSIRSLTVSLRTTTKQQPLQR
jgi:2-methylcitrate dehydratase PrpD